jgi:hypothetical protein
VIDGFILSGSGALAGMEFVPGALEQAAPALAARVAEIAASGKRAHFWIGRGQARSNYRNMPLNVASFVSYGPAQKLTSAYIAERGVIEQESDLPVDASTIEQLVRQAFAGEASSLVFDLV